MGQLDRNRGCACVACARSSTLLRSTRPDSSKATLPREMQSVHPSWPPTTPGNGVLPQVVQDKSSLGANRIIPSGGADPPGPQPFCYGGQEPEQMKASLEVARANTPHGVCRNMRAVAAGGNAVTATRALQLTNGTPEGPSAKGRGPAVCLPRASQPRGGHPPARHSVRTANVRAAAAVDIWKSGRIAIDGPSLSISRLDAITERSAQSPDVSYGCAQNSPAHKPEPSLPERRQEQSCRLPSFCGNECRHEMANLQRTTGNTTPLQCCVFGTARPSYSPGVSVCVSTFEWRIARSRSAISKCRVCRGCARLHPSTRHERGE